MKALQLFSKEYLEQCRGMKPEGILRFLDDFRQLHGEEKVEKSILISLKVRENLLRTFRTKAQLQGIPYQTQIKKLMTRWIEEQKP